MKISELICKLFELKGLIDDVDVLIPQVGGTDDDSFCWNADISYVESKTDEDDNVFVVIY